MGCDEYENNHLRHVTTSQSQPEDIIMSVDRQQSVPESSCWLPFFDRPPPFPSTRRSASCELDSSGDQLGEQSAAINVNGNGNGQKQRLVSSSASSFPSKRTKRSASYACLRAVTTTSSTMHFFPKQTPNLQLPSFDALGIAVPSPPHNRKQAPMIPQPQAGAVEPGAGPVEYRDSVDDEETAPQGPPPLITDLSSLPSSSSLSDDHDHDHDHDQDDHDLDHDHEHAANVTIPQPSYPSSLPVTPPEYDDSVRWNLHERDPSTFAVPPHSSSSSPPVSRSRSAEPARSRQRGSRTPVNESSESANASRPQESAPPPADLKQPNGQVSHAMPDISSFSLPEDDGLWLEQGYAAAVSSLPISKRAGEAVQLISQTLPCPASETPASASPPSAFIPIVQAIQRRLQPDHSPYINIIHAVPPRFSLSSLPTSPPSTPNLLFPDNDSYFNLTVFSSATPVPSYPHPDFVASPIADGRPPSAYAPTPIVPPYSVHVSVIERYLPPPTPQEYQDLFSVKGPSVLVDRLLELSPLDGTLVFIYPTKQGARTFEQHYLSPILDPLLRHLVVVNGLSADTSMALGSMGAIPQMDDFPTMRSRVRQLCHDLNTRNKPSPSTTHSNFDLVYSAKGGAHVDRRLWTEWHVQQDTPRARTLLSNNWRTRGRHVSSDSASTGTRQPMDGEGTLLRALIDGFRSRSLREVHDPDEPLELGMFVIRRSDATNE